MCVLHTIGARGRIAHMADRESSRKRFAIGSTERAARISAKAATAAIWLPTQADAEITPADPAVLSTLASQLDLRRIATDPSVVVYENVSWRRLPPNAKCCMACGSSARDALRRCSATPFDRSTASSSPELPAIWMMRQWP